MWLEIVNEHAVRQGKLRRILTGESKSVIIHLIKLWLYPHAIYDTKDHWMHEIETFINEIPLLKSGELPKESVVFKAIWNENQSKVNGFVRTVVKMYEEMDDEDDILHPYPGYKNDISSMKTNQLDPFIEKYSGLISKYGYYGIDPKLVDREMLNYNFISRDEYDRRIHKLGGR